jgi:RND family efflux transporter MFP subunit
MTRGKKIQTMRTLFPLGAIGAAMVGCSHEEPKPAQSSPPPIVHAEVVTIAEQATPLTYVATGSIQASMDAMLSSKVLGRVISIDTREGDSVRRGQSLVSIDARELESAVRVADANHVASVVGVDSARTAARMEAKTSRARIAQARAQVEQAQAGLAAAIARRDLVVAGPRKQEIAQSHIAVLQAESSMKLVALERDRTAKLVQDGALAQRELDLAQNRFDLAKGQFDAAVQSENIAREGSRSQEIRAAEEAVQQAKGALAQAKSAVAQAEAAASQVEMRLQAIQSAGAQTQQTAAASQAARVSLSYARVSAPFDGKVVSRLADPGTMASPGVPLLRIEGGDYRLNAVVPESLLGVLSRGTAAPVTIDALGQDTRSGRVVEIVPQGNAASHSFLVKFALESDPRLKSGMYGKVSLTTGTARRLLIPQSATWKREGLNYVFALNKDGTARLRIVTLGAAVGDRVEVLSSLSPGDRIVVGDRSGVTDGAKVEAK